MKLETLEERFFDQAFHASSFMFHDL